MRIPLLLSQSPGLLLKSALYVKQEVCTRPRLTRSARVLVEELLLVFGAAGGYSPWVSVVCERLCSRGITEKGGGAFRPRGFARHCRLECSHFPCCLAPGEALRSPFWFLGKVIPVFPTRDHIFSNGFAVWEGCKGDPSGWLAPGLSLLEPRTLLRNFPLGTSRPLGFLPCQRDYTSLARPATLNFN